MLNNQDYRSLPFLLIYGRILLGFIIPLILFLSIPKASFIATVLILVGLLTDIFDGIVARQMGISSEKLRIWDSNVDQFFWLMVIGTVFYLNYSIIKAHLSLIIIIVILETLAYLFSYFKFKRVIATHSILAKIWTISLMVWIIEIILFQTNYTFPICFLLGLISRIEIIMIIVLLKKWATDIPSIFVVNKINRGEVIKKNKWFNS